MCHPIRETRNDRYRYRRRQNHNYETDKTRNHLMILFLVLYGTLFSSSTVALEEGLAIFNNITISITLSEDGLELPVSDLTFTIYETPQFFPQDALGIVQETLSSFATEQLKDLYSSSPYLLDKVSLEIFATQAVSRKVDAKRREISLYQPIQKGNSDSTAFHSREKRQQQQLQKRHLSPRRSLQQQQQRISYGTAFYLTGKMTFLDTPTPDTTDANDDLTSVLRQLQILQHKLQSLGLMAFQHITSISLQGRNVYQQVDFATNLTNSDSNNTNISPSINNTNTNTTIIDKGTIATASDEGISTTSISIIAGVACAGAVFLLGCSIFLVRRLQLKQQIDEPRHLKLYDDGAMAILSSSHRKPPPDQKENSSFSETKQFQSIDVESKSAKDTLPLQEPEHFQDLEKNSKVISPSNAIQISRRNVEDKENFSTPIQTNLSTVNVTIAKNMEQHVVTQDSNPIVSPLKEKNSILTKDLRSTSSYFGFENVLSFASSWLPFGSVSLDSTCGTGHKKGGWESPDSMDDVSPSSPVISVTSSKVSKEEFHEDWEEELPFDWVPTKKNIAVDEPLVTGAFPRFHMDDSRRGQETVQPCSARQIESDSSSAYDSSSLRTSHYQSSYTSGSVHPLDWSNKGYDVNSLDDSTLTDSELNTINEKNARIVWERYMELERRRKIQEENLRSKMSQVNNSRSSSINDNNGHEVSLEVTDLVWLEKKISDVRRQNVNPHHDDASFESAVESLSSEKDLSPPVRPFSSINRNIVYRDCKAPPGKLHLVIHSTNDGPAVHSVKPGSPLEGYLFPGDLIIAVDEVDTRQRTADNVMKILVERNTRTRKITVVRCDGS